MGAKGELRALCQRQSTMPLDNTVWREGQETRPFGYSVLT